MTFTYDLTSKHTANWEKWLAEFKDRPCAALEIGCFEGQSTIWLCRNILTHEHSRLICVDTWQWMNARPVFDANVKEAGLELKLDIRQQSSLWFSAPPDTLDFVYVDGNHAAERVLADAVLMWRSLKVGGIAIFDDYLLAREGRMEVKLAVDAFLRVFASSLVLVASGYQVCVRRTK